MYLRAMCLTLSTWLFATASAPQSARAEDSSSATSSGVRSSESLRITDVAGEFISFWDKTKNMPDQERVKLFMIEIASKAPDLYENTLFSYCRNVLHADLNKRIAEQLTTFPMIRNRYEQVYAELSKSMTHYLNRFKGHFSDFRSDDVDVYIAHSLGGANGAANLVHNRTLFYLGVDMIAIHNDYSNQEPFFDHEFFHVYHVQKYKLNNQFYSQLWMEGLATYVAKDLNPEATNAELMMNDDLIARTKKVLPQLIPEVANNLETLDTDGKLRFKYFNIESKDNKIPPRAGYYIGYLILQQIAKNTTIAEMTEWQEEKIVPAMRNALKTIARTNQIDLLTSPIFQLK